MTAPTGSSNIKREGRPTSSSIRMCEAGTVEPADFNKIGDHVVAYYVDQGFVNRTIVALKDFGPSATQIGLGNRGQDQAP